jgi:hypothetical protein
MAAEWLHLAGSGMAVFWRSQSKADFVEEWPG